MINQLKEINWQLILMLAGISAVVAYVGDIVGMKIGKRRISIFGLRPRYTSTVISALTGVLITLCTLFVVAYSSDTVRSAVLGMKIVQRQITEMTAQLQQSRREIEQMEFEVFTSRQDVEGKKEELAKLENSLESERARLGELNAELITAKDLLKTLQEQKGTLTKSVENLTAQSKKLQDGLQQVRGGRIAVFAGEVLSQVISDGADSAAEKSERLIDLLLRNAKQSIILRDKESANKTDNDIKISIGDAEKSKINAYLARNDGRTVLRLVSKSNAVSGENIEAQIKTYPSLLIYRAQQEIASLKIGAGLTEEKAEQGIYSLLHEVNQRTVRKGVIPNPLSGNVGTLTANEFFDAVEKASMSKTDLLAVVTAQDDIYSEGPVMIKIAFKNL